MEYIWVLAKVLIVYVSLIVMLRVLGKREVGELSIFDLVVLLIIADIASLGIDNDDFLWMGLLSCVLIVVLQKVLSVFLLHHGKYRSWIDGSPVTIVKDGKLLVQNMKKEHYTIDDLIYQMRLEHIMDIEEIRLAILETNGTLSIFRVSQFDTIRLPVITSGTMVKESFSVLGIDEATISEAFAKEGIDPKAILYASYGQGLIYYFYKTDDKATELTRKQLELPVKNTVKGDK